MENFEGKHFSITDPQNVRTVVYEVSKTEKEFEKNMLEKKSEKLFT